MTAVNFFNDHVNARQERLEHIDRPFFQRFGHNRVVGIGDDCAGDCPSLVPLKVVLVNQNAHEFGDAKGRVRVVDVNCDFLVKFANVAAGANEMPNNALRARRNKEVLLNQAHTLAFAGAVIGIEVFGDTFDEIAVLILLAHLLMRQHAVIRKVAVNFSIPQAQRVDRLIMITDNRHVVRHSHNSHCVFMDKLKGAVRLLFHVSVAVELDID